MQGGNPNIVCGRPPGPDNKLKHSQYQADPDNGDNNPYKQAQETGQRTDYESLAAAGYRVLQISSLFALPIFGRCGEISSEKIEAIYKYEQEKDEGQRLATMDRHSGHQTPKEIGQRLIKPQSEDQPHIQAEETDQQLPRTAQQPPRGANDKKEYQQKI
jgi:hypothetical protein